MLIGNHNLGVRGLILLSDDEAVPFLFLQPMLLQHLVAALERDGLARTEVFVLAATRHEHVGHFERSRSYSPLIIISIVMLIHLVGAQGLVAPAAHRLGWIV